MGFVCALVCVLISLWRPTVDDGGFAFALYFEAKFLLPASTLNVELPSLAELASPKSDLIPASSVITAGLQVCAASSNAGST